MTFMSEKGFRATLFMHICKKYIFEKKPKPVKLYTLSFRFLLDIDYVERYIEYSRKAFEGLSVRYRGMCGYVWRFTGDAGRPMWFLRAALLSVFIK